MKCSESRKVSVVFSKLYEPGETFLVYYKPGVLGTFSDVHGGLLGKDLLNLLLNLLERVDQGCTNLSEFRGFYLGERGHSITIEFLEHVF